MTYSYNKKGKQVTAVASDNVINSEMCFVDGATHVVTEVKYGFNAYKVNVKTIRRKEQIFVAFSEKLNFISSYKLCLPHSSEP